MGEGDGAGSGSEALLGEGIRSREPIRSPSPATAHDLGAQPRSRAAKPPSEARKPLTVASTEVHLDCEGERVRVARRRLRVRSARSAAPLQPRRQSARGAQSAAPCRAGGRPARGRRRRRAAPRGPAGCSRSHRRPQTTSAPVADWGKAQRRHPAELLSGAAVDRRQARGRRRKRTGGVRCSDQSATGIRSHERRAASPPGRCCGVDVVPQHHGPVRAVGGSASTSTKRP